MQIIVLLALLNGGNDWMAGPGEQEDIDRLVGIRTFALYTNFDSGLAIDDAPGILIDARAILNGAPDFRFYTGIGFAGWVTDNDSNNDNVDIAQYRFCLGVEYDFRTLDAGLGFNTGSIAMHRTGEGDDSVFFEFELSLGYRPSPFLRIGVLALATHQYSAFNHKHNHMMHNYSVGVGAELRF